MRDTVQSDSGCWEWQRCKNPAGYGRVGLRGHDWIAHRLMWFCWHESDPGEAYVLHTCDNPACINPDHLFLGTQADNISDMCAKGRQHTAYSSETLNRIQQWWTPERRAAKGELYLARVRKQHNEAALAAGVPTEHKRCPSCEQWLPREAYHLNARRFDGLCSYCKSCRAVRHKAQYHSHG